MFALRQCIAYADQTQTEYRSVKRYHRLYDPPPTDSQLAFSTPLPVYPYISYTIILTYTASPSECVLARLQTNVSWKRYDPDLVRTACYALLVASRWHPTRRFPGHLHWQKASLTAEGLILYTLMYLLLLFFCAHPCCHLRTSSFSFSSLLRRNQPRSGVT